MTSFKPNRHTTGAAIVGLAVGLAACGGPRIDRTGWECWEEQPCAEGYFCNEAHLCEQELIEDIPGVVPAALSAFNEGIRAMNSRPRDYEEALDAFTRATELDPDFWEAYENRGLILMDLGRYRDAAETFEAEAALIEDLVGRDWPVEPRIEVYLNIGKARALAGDVSGATEAFGTMLQLDPENVEARANLAALNVQVGEPDTARQFVQELLVLSQNDVGALSVLAQIAKDTGDMQLAEYLWEKAIQEIAASTEMLDVECPQWAADGGADFDMLSAEGQWCAQYTDLTDEQVALRRAYNSRRGDRMLKVLSDIQNELGIVAWNGDNDDQAESLFRQSVENNPSNSAARVNLGTVYLEYANWEQACVQFGEALALRPRERAGLIGYAACAFGSGELEEAMARYEAAHAQYPNDDFMTTKLGDIAFQGLGDYETALQWYGRTLELRGTNIDTCDAASDEVCQKMRSIRDVMRQQREIQNQQQGEQQ